MGTPSFQPFALLKERFGFVPNLFRAPSLPPGVVPAVVRLVDTFLFQESALARIQKECLLLLLAAARGDTACATLHYQMLRLHSVPEQRLDQILADYRIANLSAQNTALVSFVLKLGSAAESLPIQEIEVLRQHGLTDHAILDAILITALGAFLGSLSSALKVAPDFPPVQLPSVVWLPEATSPVQSERSAAFLNLPALRPDAVEAEAELIQAVTDAQAWDQAAGTAVRSLLATCKRGLGAAGTDLEPEHAPQILRKNPHLSPPEPRQTDVAASADPDAGVVARVRGGDLTAFEELMNRHSQRVYRTLIGWLGDAEESRDAMQDTFLKAFRNLNAFEGRSKFSTWLISIANNTAMQRLRDRKPTESLDESESEEGFRPRQIQAWMDNPEQTYSRTEMRALIESSIMKLPAKYRVVVLLRDVEQLSAAESAAALNLGIPALKARLLRGRLMLREALSPHLVASSGSAKGVTS